MNQCSDGSYCVKTVLLVERHSDRRVIAVSQGLNFKSRNNLSALEPSDQGPMYVRKFRVLSFCSASAKSEFSIVAVNEDIMNSCFHPPGVSRCLRKSSSATCSSDSREGCVFDADSSFTAKLGVLEREQDFSTSVSDREQGFSLPVSEREH